MKESYQLLISQCRSTTKKTLSSLLQGFFDELDDTLYEASDATSESTLREDYLQAMRDTRKDRSAMESIFKKNILEGFDNFVSEDDILLSPSESEDEFDLGELSLVGEDDMEESLAISNMTAKAESKFSEELSALNKRFAVILSCEVIKSEDNPLAPKFIGNSFVEAMKELTLGVTEEKNNLTIRLVIYKKFDLNVFKYIGAFYDDLNELLHKGGIDQKSPKKFRKNPVAPVIKQELPVTPAPQETTENAESEDYQPAPMYPQLGGGAYSQNFPPPPSYQELTGLVRQQYVQTVEGLVDPDLPVVPPQQLAGMVAALQNQALMAGGAINDLNASIYKALRKGGDPKSVRQEDQDVINVISMLFDFVLDDPNLPDNMRVLISKLQIPMLKVAVIDKTFFSNKNHAARSLLNNIASASVDLTGDLPIHKPLIKRIESIINRIVDEFKDNVSLFTLLDEEFIEFLEKENKRAFIAEKRTAQTNQGQEQRKIAKAKVAAAINSRVHGHRLPKVVKKLLVDPWNTLLNLAYLKNGEEDPRWIKGLKIIDTLMWTLSGSSDIRERKKIIKTIPGLLIEIRDSLKSISYNSQDMILLLKGLQEAHVISLRQSSPDKKERETQAESTKKLSPELKEAVTVEAVNNTLVDAPIDLSEKKERTVAEEEDEAFKKANTLEIGAWVEWVDEKGESIRGKLSWKSGVTGILVFVNRKGMKIAEMDVDELAELLRKDTTKDLKDTNMPLMDRALSAMVEVLKKSETIVTGD